MLYPWYQISMLSLEANQVIGLRLMKMARGGSAAIDEAKLMVSEKVDAAIEAGATLMSGGSPLSVVERYREHVAANSQRLA